MLGHEGEFTGKEAAEDRLSLREGLELFSLISLFFAVIGGLIWLSLRIEFNAFGSGGHAFDILYRSFPSPNGRYVVELRDVGDDDDAFSEWKLNSKKNSNEGGIDLPAGTREVHWHGNYTLEVALDDSLSNDPDKPTSFRGVTVKYVEYLEPLTNVDNPFIL